MRARAVFAIVLLVLPVVAEAQRMPVPRIRDRGPARPAPLPPTAGVVAREMYYVRLPYTVESYPLVSYFSAPGLAGDLQSFVAGGLGERLDLRLSRTLSLTLDLTQSFVGGPAVTQTAELGVRARPEGDATRRWLPFLDARAGFVHVAERELRPYDYVDPMSGGYYQSAGGLGAVVATGVEYALHPRFTLTTGGSLVRANLAPFTNGARSFDRSTLTAVRYSIGVRYNPGQWTMPGTLPQRSAM